MSVFINTVSSLIYMATGLTIKADELAYFVGLYTALASAYLVKNKLQQSIIPKHHQLYLIGFVGLWIYYSIWGWYMILPIAQVTVAYVLSVSMPIAISARYIFVFAMSFLSLCHLHIVYLRLNAFEVNQSADYTGPLMIITQRITALAYSIQDGLTKSDKELNEIQKKYAVKKMPTFSEYFAYMFSFTGIMCGPFAFYNDVMPILQGSYKKKDDAPFAPSLGRAVFAKVTGSMCFIYLYCVGAKSFPCHLNVDQSFIENSSLLHRLIFLYVSLFLARAKYYGAWLFGDAVHNIMGIGFNGYDDQGQARWDLISNVNILNIEFATGLKTYIDNWNLMTVKWIRYVSYDRTNPKYRTIKSFILSAFWHGFFPGYYIMFLTCHTWLLVQRKARRTIRPLFQSSSFHRGVYASITFALTQLGIAYSALAFVTLEWNASIRFYKSVWFVGHIIGFTFFLLIPSSKNSVTSSSSLPKGTSYTNGVASKHEIPPRNGQQIARNN